MSNRKVGFSVMSPEEIVEALKKMENDPSFITESAYKANSQIWPDNRISFVESHMLYLKNHPALNPQHYLANLKLMTKARR